MNMLAQDHIFLTVALLWFFFLIGLSILIYEYTKLQKKLERTERAKHILELSTHEQSLALLDRARLQALSILEAAQKQAQDIVKSAQITESTADATLNAGLQAVTKTQTAILNKTANEFLSEFEQTMKNTQQEDINILKDVSKSITNTANAEISDFKSILAQETVASQKMVEEKVQEAYKEALLQIENYKKEKLNEVDGKLYEYIQGAATTILGHALTAKDHQELIQQSLADAKKEQGL